MFKRNREASDFRPRVLLADDHESLLVALTRLIAPSYAVVAARSGAEALELARQIQPDVIVMDVHLPDIDGLEVYRRLTTSELRSQVVILTAGDDPDLKQKALALGASGFVLKYRAGEELLPAIEAALATACREP